MFRLSSSLFAVVWCVIQTGPEVLAAAQPASDDGGILPPAAQRTVDFTTDVIPLLRDRCFVCHQGSDPDSGVRLDHHAKLLGETDGIPLVVCAAFRSGAKTRLPGQRSG